MSSPVPPRPSRTESVTKLSQSLSNDISQAEVDRHLDEVANSRSSTHPPPRTAPAPRAAAARGARSKNDVLGAVLAADAAAAPAPLPPGGHLPKLRHSESAAASLQHELPPLPMQQLQRASTANGLRLTHLPTPKGTLSSRLDFKLPSSPGNSSLSGLVGAHNMLGSECLFYLNLVEKSSEQESPSSPGKASTEAAYYSPIELERQRKARASAYDAALHQITRLGNERRVMLESADKHASGGGGGDASERAAAAAARRAEAAEAAKREAMNAVSEQQKKLRRSRSASGRVEARLLELRVDESARQELERRVTRYKQQRADGRGETRDFVRENRTLTSSLSASDMLVRKGDASRDWAVKVLAVQSRLAEIERERELLNLQREQAFLTQSQQRLSPRELILQRRASTAKAGGGGADGGGAEGASDRHMAPRERAAAAKLEQERRKRWLLLLALCSRASFQLDLLVWDRNSRDENKTVDRAARLIQRKHVSKQMRKQLLQLNHSVMLLRNNIARFAFAWKLRKKVRSMDTIRAFLIDVSGKSSMARTVHNFLHKVIKVQRKWRRYATIIAAQLGLFSIQFDKLLHSKRSAELHLTPDEHKQWTKKLSKLMLEKADTQTRAGQRDLKRQQTKAAAEAAAAEEAVAEGGGDDGDAEAAAGEGDDDAKGGKKKGKGKKGQDGAPSAAGPDSSRFGVVDLDCKLVALSRCLRRRKMAFRKEMREYTVELERSQNMIAKHKEMEEMRLMFAAPVGGGEGGAPDAKGGVTDLAAQVGDFAKMVSVTAPPPRPSILLRPEEVQPLIAEALMLTADKFREGKPVDPHKSVGGVRLLG